MGNITTTLKRFLSNKNTVTIIGVLLGIIVLYVGYNYRVRSAISTISVPVAKTTLASRTQITADMLTTTEVLSSMVSSNKSTIISNMANLINQTDPYCVVIGTSVPAGAFFHNEQVSRCAIIQGNALKNMPDGYNPVSLPVDLHKTYGNSMYPGDYIDLYVRMTSTDGTNRLIYGKLISKLPILDVVDGSGKSVFATATVGTPAELLFAAPNHLDEYGDLNLYLLLSKAILLGTGKVELIPVPGNASFTNTPGETRVTSNYLMQAILDYTQDIPDEAVE